VWSGYKAELLESNGNVRKCRWVSVEKYCGKVLDRNKWVVVECGKGDKWKEEIGWARMPLFMLF